MTKKVIIEFEVPQELMQKIYTIGLHMYDGHQSLLEAALNNYLDSFAPMLEQDIVDPFADAILASFSFDDVNF